MKCKLIFRGVNGDENYWGTSRQLCPNLLIFTHNFLWELQEAGSVVGAVSYRTILLRATTSAQQLSIDETYVMDVGSSRTCGMETASTIYQTVSFTSISTVITPSIHPIQLLQLPIAKVSTDGGKESGCTAID